MHYIGCKDNQKNWITYYLREKINVTFLRPTEQASKLERTLTLTGTGTVIFEGSTVNNINNKWRGFEEGERGCFEGGLFELTR